jgi:Flp pilus assembly protein TadD
MYDHMLRDYRKDGPDSPAGLTEQGKSMALAGMYEDAIESFSKAIKSQPDYDEAHYGLACSCMAMGRAEEAEAEFRKALEINGSHAGAHSDLGNCYLYCGRPDPNCNWDILFLPKNT